MVSKNKIRFIRTLIIVLTGSIERKMLDGRRKMEDVYKMADVRCMKLDVCIVLHSPHSLASVILIFLIGGVMSGIKI